MLMQECKEYNYTYQKDIFLSLERGCHHWITTIAGERTDPPTELGPECMISFPNIGFSNPPSHL